MNKEEYEALVLKLGKEAADQIKAHADKIEKELNEKFVEMQKGVITKEIFEEWKKEFTGKELKELNDKLAKADDVAREQGIIITTLKESGSGKVKQISLEKFITDQAVSIKEMREKGNFVEFTATQLKAAGVTSIGGTVQSMGADAPTSPYLPGLGGETLEIFDITRDPNFILNRVDVGRTNQSRLAWINETAFEGAVSTEIDEGGDKPLTQHKFKVEISQAKKAAAYIELTDEFEEDLPYLATQVRRMLQDDVIRAFDSSIQAAVIAAARPYEITGLNDQIEFANDWDALGALMAQVAKYNYVANTIALNPVTMWQVYMQKDDEGRYLLPPFADVINQKKVEATKVAEGYALVGDMKQYKVDIYKEFVLKIGWINDNLIKNKFCIVGEIRYHRYISDNRKKALAYSSLNNVVAAINNPTSA